MAIDELQSELDEIYLLVEAKNYTALKAKLGEMEIHDLAALLLELEDETLAVVFRMLPRQDAADVFGDLEFEQQEKLTESLSQEKVASIVNDMPPDDRTELLEELPGEVAQRLMSTLRGDELRIARSLLGYPEESIGRLMTPEYVSVGPDWTIERVFTHIREVAEQTETLNVVYVIDDHGKLLDEIRLEQLVLADLTNTISDLMDKQAASLDANEDREGVIELFKKYDAVALPVVDSQGVLVGIVTVDDVMDVAEEEDTEDFQKMAAIVPLESSYFATSFREMIGKRLPWLALLLVAQTLTTIALIGFERLPYFTIIVLFVPLINSPAGNTGSQMAGIMIRGLAVQEMDTGDWLRVLFKELARGLMLGVLLGLMGFIAASLFAKGIDTKDYNPTGIALSVGLSITAAVTLANILGSMLPFFFKKVGLDPAVTSGPFIASLMDVSGIIIYFSVAATMLATTT